MLNPNRILATAVTNYMGFRSCSSDCWEQQRPAAKATVGDLKNGPARVRKVNGKKERVEIQMPLLLVSILDMEELACSIFYNGNIKILSDPGFELDRFITEIKDVDGSMLIHESVVDSRILK